MHQYYEDIIGGGDATYMENQHRHHFLAPTLYHPAAGILSGSAMPLSHLNNARLHQIPPSNPPSSPVEPAACPNGAHNVPSFSEISTRLETLQHRHPEGGAAPTHSLFQASRTVNGPRKRQRDSDDEEGEEAVSRLRSRGVLASAQKHLELASSPQHSNGSNDESDMEEDGTDRDYFNRPFVREIYMQRPHDPEE